MLKYSRKEIWSHNAARGQAAMIKGCALSIAKLRSATKRSTRLALEIAELAVKLQRELEERR